MIAVIIIAALVMGVGGFFAGMKYQQSKSPAGRFANFQGARNSNFQQRGANMISRQGFRPVNGEIISSDDKSITVKLSDGSSKIVLLSDQTSINKSSAGTKSDLKNGEKVAVFGSDNSDGSVTAQNIQLNPYRPQPNGSPR
ncbi:MAG: DUF5666 domain-containing protein [Patescibacteria group bacterium]|nr:DUF5666 domain-containing protein [Patescibacteria group bacterium]